MKKILQSPEESNNKTVEASERNILDTHTLRQALKSLHWNHHKL